MKYMGSKTTLLNGGLGTILLETAQKADRFVDLFAGSGAVAHYMAQNSELPVLSVDLQEYARIFASAVTERTVSVADEQNLLDWLPAVAEAGTQKSGSASLTANAVNEARAAAESSSEGFITRHYGGHYFSLAQAREFDALYSSLPAAEPARTVAFAALLQAASVCAAAPGHTAQPFQPTESLLPYIQQSWSRSVAAAVTNAFDQLAPIHANVKGEARVGDAQSTVDTLREGDLVFCDPPYSAAQYSRFYHVLEGIARGGWDQVSGKGRAPALTSRKKSDFSMKSKASEAMKQLLNGLRQRGCHVIITFPNANASNGLSGQEIIALADASWIVDPHYLDSVHSTLGGANAETGGRGGRRKLKEAVIVLTPKPAVVNVPIELSKPAKLRVAGRLPESVTA